MNASASLGRWERDLLTFVRVELAPNPARWRASIRTTLSCAVGICLITILQIPAGEFLMVSLFVLTKMDAWASLNKAVLRVIGTCAGGGIGVLAIIAFGDKPWLLLPFQGLIVAATLFFNRTTTAPYAFMIGGLTFLMVVPDFITTPDFNLEQGLWRTALTLLGVFIGTGGQLLLWPDHPEALLLDDLCRRLRLVEDLIGRLSSSNVAGKTPSVADPVAATGMAAQLDLLKEAEATSPYLRQRHPEQIKLIVDVQRLVSASVRLERATAGAALSPFAAERVERVRQNCSRMREAIAERMPPAAPLPSSVPPLPAGSERELAVLAAIEEMEQALAAMPPLLAFLDFPTEARSPLYDRLPRDPVAVRTLLTPACTLANTEVVQHAIKGGVASVICGVIYTTLQAPQLATCVITCMVVAQTTVGAGRNKSILRLVGTFLGGFSALLAIVTLMPNMTSLASLLVVATPLYFAVAWILAGSSRIAYVGFQMGIGLSLVLINGPKPALELAPALDRFLGVVIGTVVFGIIDLVVWPVFARSAIRRKLVEAMRQMAVLQRASAARDEPAVQREAITIYRTLTDSVALQDGLQLEPEVRETDAAERDQALRLTSSLQDTFLYLLAVWRHRQSLDEAAPGEAAALATLDQQSAQRLTALAEGTPCPSLSSASVEAIAETSSSPRVRELAVVYRGLLESLGRLPTKATTEEHG